MSQPLISFVIATLNRKDSLKNCLDSIRRQTYPLVEVVVVDNGSTDETSEFIRREYPEAVLILSHVNLGVAGGRSAGLQKARGQFIVQLDDDETFPDPTVCDFVVTYFQKYEQVGVLSFNILDTTTHQTASRTIPRRDKRMLHDDSPCGYFLGGGCAFRAEMLRKVGYYWDALNPYGAEEFDLSIRILEKGYGILWTKDIRIYHFESGLERPNERRTYAETRNRIWVAIRHLPWVYVATHLIAWWGYGMLLALRAHAWHGYWRGVLDCIRGMPVAIKSRKKVNRRTISILRKYSGPLYY